MSSEITGWMSERFTFMSEASAAGPKNFFPLSITIYSMKHDLNVWKGHLLYRQHTHTLTLMELSWILKHEADDHTFLYAFSLLFITQSWNLSLVALLKGANGSAWTLSARSPWCATCQLAGPVCSQDNRQKAETGRDKNGGKVLRGKLKMTFAVIISWHAMQEKFCIYSFFFIQLSSLQSHKKDVFFFKKRNQIKSVWHNQ